MKTKTKKKPLVVDGYRVSNSNGSARFGSANMVRVYDRNDGLLVAIEVPQRSPLGYLRAWPNGKYGAMFRDKLLACGVPAETIDRILQVKP